MNYLALLALSTLFVPIHASAAISSAFESGGSVLVATSTPGNRYAFGGSVTITAPIAGDLTALGGSVVSDGSVSGDALYIGGSVASEAPIGGDVRILAGRATLSAPVSGDLVAAAGSFTDLGGGATSVYVVGAEVTLAKGARGPVRIYANNIALDGVFFGDVTVSAAGRLALASTTVIHGVLTYEAPEAAVIPEGASIAGGVRYTGTSYLPTSEEAHAIALASFGIFLFIKILGALILAGLVAGLFPAVADEVRARTRATSSRRTLLSLLLGFAILVATPIFLVLLAITFVGLGLAILLGLLYFVLIILAFIYAAVILGALAVRLLLTREEPRWSDAVFGMLILFVIWSIPVIGSPLIFAMTMYTLGLLVLMVYQFAFPRE